MTFFEANKSSPDEAFTPVELLLEETWGEIWRALRTDGHPVILVAYTTPEGDELFEETLEALERWKNATTSTVAPSLMQILEINQGAIPYILVDDTTGKTLREVIIERQEESDKKVNKAKFTLEEQGNLMWVLSSAAVAGKTYNLDPMGITPDLIFENPGDTTYRWRLLPVAPCSNGQVNLLNQGHYFPDLAKKTEQIGRLNPDSYSIGKIWYCVIRGDLDAELPDDPAKEIPHEGLRFVLQLCFEFKEGSYPEAGALMSAVKRWIGNSLREDAAKARQKEIDRRRGPILTFFARYGGVFLKVGVGAASFVIFFALGYFIVSSGWLLPDNRSFMKSEDVLNMYLGDTLEGDSSRLHQLLHPDLFEVHNDMIEIIDDLESSGRIAKWNGYHPYYAGRGSTYTVDTRLLDNKNNHFATLNIVLQKRADHKWYVSELYFINQAPG